MIAARKLRHCFEAHRVRVLTNQPLNEIFENRDAAPRISKWALELSQYVVDFKRRSAIKSRVLADFIVDWTESNQYGMEPV